MGLEGLWSKMGEGGVAGTVGPFDHRALTPSHFSSSALCGMSSLLVYYFVPTVCHQPPGKDSDGTKMLPFIRHGHPSFGLTTLPSSGQGQSIDVPIPEGPRSRSQ